MLTLNDTVQAYVAEFHARAAELDGPAELLDTRRRALSRFREFGFPTTRHEEWKYTSVAQLAKTSFVPTQPTLNGQARELAIAGVADCRLVFVNGRYQPNLSFITALPGGVLVTNLASAFRTQGDLLAAHLTQQARFDEQQVFVALNTALMQDGAFVYLPSGRVVEEPIHVLHISTGEGTPSVSHPRNLVILEDDAQTTIIESYVGLNGGAYFTNAVTELVAGERTVIDHYKVELESNSAFHIATQQSRQGTGSNFSTHNISFGGALVRNDINATLAGRGSEATVNGLYVVGGRQHVDNHTGIDHAQPHCNSHELYKGVIAGSATGVFNGKIFVRRDAQKTDAKQTNQNLLLSRDATINTKPQLQIYADDVKCTHGATVGQLDADALFYLRTRGIPRVEAEALLTFAFASDLLGRIKIAPLRTMLEAELFQRLPKEARA